MMLKDIFPKFSSSYKGIYLFPLQATHERIADKINIYINIYKLLNSGSVALL